MNGTGTAETPRAPREERVLDAEGREGFKVLREPREERVLRIV